MYMHICIPYATPSLVIRCLFAYFQRMAALHYSGEIKEMCRFYFYIILYSYSRVHVL
jgi:hypothetical protein